MSVPVFPGVEGFGTDTSAGRGGQIIRVTTLANSGPGSLREALYTQGPRTIVFEVGGVIWLQSDLNIWNPFLTVAGQTAPSPGITIAGGGMKIRTHDVLMQHLACRGAVDNGVALPGSEDGSVEVYNVVIDHCSISWAANKNLNTWYSGVHDVTISHCIISESLSLPGSQHHMGFLVGDHAQRIAVIGNLFAHNSRRNPGVFGTTSSLVLNNAIYNAVDYSIQAQDSNHSGPLQTSVVGNVIIPGPSSPDTGPPITIVYDCHPDSLIYLKDNQAPSPPLINLTAFHLATEPPIWAEPLTVRPSDSVLEWVLANAGAQPWDRDPVDERVVSDVLNGGGQIIDSPDEVGGWPQFTPTSRTLDLPDDPNGDEDGDGYTNLEKWIWTFEKGGDIMGVIENLRAMAIRLRAEADALDAEADALVMVDTQAQATVTEAQEALTAAQVVEEAL